MSDNSPCEVEDLIDHGRAFINVFVWLYVNSLDVLALDYERFILF